MCGMIKSYGSPNRSEYVISPLGWQHRLIWRAPYEGASERSWMAFRCPLAHIPQTGARRMESFLV